jgi:hypothetical protein
MLHRMPSCSSLTAMVVGMRLGIYEKCREWTVESYSRSRNKSNGSRRHRTRTRLRRKRLHMAEVATAIHRLCLSAFPNAGHNGIALPYSLAKYSGAPAKTSDLKVSNTTRLRRKLTFDVGDGRLRMPNITTWKSQHSIASHFPSGQKLPAPVENIIVAALRRVTGMFARICIIAPR